MRRLEADLKDMSGVLCETMAKEATFRLGCRSLIMTQQLARSQAALEHTPSGRLEKREANIQQREADLRHTDREQKKAKKTEKEEVKDNRLLVEKLFDKNFKPLPKWCYKGFRYHDERTYLVEEAEDIMVPPWSLETFNSCGTASPPCSTSRETVSTASPRTTWGQMGNTATPSSPRTQH